MSRCSLPNRQDIRNQINIALREDVGFGDISAHLIAAEQVMEATIVVNASGVLCGQAWVDEVFYQLGNRVDLFWHSEEGAAVEGGQVVCTLQGIARDIVTGERTALNFLQTLSATASLTRQYVDRIKHTQAVLLDTRKTLPGLRVAQKYAVRCGGGSNHRIGLYDGYLLKENHLSAFSSLHEAVELARAHHPDKSLVVEVETLDELNQALACGVTHIMLDNFSAAAISEAVALTRARAALEVSGNVLLEQIASIAELGVDYISVGALTKQVVPLDLSLRYTHSEPA